MNQVVHKLSAPFPHLIVENMYNQEYNFLEGFANYTFSFAPFWFVLFLAILIIFYIYKFIKNLKNIRKFRYKSYVFLHKYFSKLHNIFRYTPLNI